MERVIAHIDMDCFFAACEVKRNPELKGKPIIVGCDPSAGRGVVSTCSYEAREYGVRSGMPISKAYAACKHGIYLPVDGQYYMEISRRIMAIIERYADIFEPMGCDEAYLDITEKIKGFSSKNNFAKAIKNEILEKENLTCSIGIAHNRSIAKMASEHDKPDGITIVKDIRQFLDPLEIGCINGVGKKFKLHLNDLGIHKIKDIAYKEKQEIEKELGHYGVWLWEIANGIDPRPIGEHEIKNPSISSETTLPKDINNFDKIWGYLEYEIDKLVETIKRDKLQCKTITLKIRFDDFETLTRSKSIPAYTDNEHLIKETLKTILYQFSDYHKKVRLIGSKLSNFTDSKEKQVGLENWC